MDRKDFQKLAVRTETPFKEAKLSELDYEIFSDTLNAFNNVVEILDSYKKHIFYAETTHAQSKYLDRKALLGLCNNARESLWNVLTKMREVREAEEPRSETKLLDINPRLLHAILGSITEHGELGIAIQKALETGELDLVNVCEEFGDSDWYKALFYEATGIDWENVQAMIIKKLEIRYADQIFSEGEAKERDLVAERKLLEETIQEAVTAYEKSSTI